MNPVGGDRADARRDEFDRLLHDAVLVLRRQAKQRFATFVAAERQDRD
jgi:hypothetical protein